MKPTELYIITIQAMLEQSTEMLEQSYHDPAIDQSRYIGEKVALEKVLRYLNNQNDLEKSHGVSLDESLAIMKKGK